MPRDSHDPRDSAPAIYALTPKGAALGRLLAREMQGTLYLPRRLANEFLEAGARPFDSLPALVEELFHLRPAHIFIAAAGVAVRMISPHLHGKDKDPAVLVLDQDGRYCISLLSGHLGGANRLAQQVAACTRGKAVVTTATDCAGAPAIDLVAREAGLTIGELSRVKSVNAALAAGSRVRCWDPQGWMARDMSSPQLVKADSPEQAQVLVDWHEPGAGDARLWLHPPCLCLGIGCRKGVSRDALERHVRNLFQEHGLALASLWAMGSVSAKKDEPGLHELAEALAVPLRFYPAQVLKAVRTPNPSQRVAQAVGAPSVCEAAALLLAGSTELLLEKQPLEDTTLALALRRPA